MQRGDGSEHENTPRDQLERLSLDLTISAAFSRPGSAALALSQGQLKAVRAELDQRNRQRTGD